MIREAIETAVRGALEALGAGDVPFVVERPGAMEHGDYATNAALAAGKFLKKNPKEVAEGLAQSLEGKIDGVKKIETAGPGFVNFTLAGMKVKDVVHEAHAPAWGTNALHTGKTVLVEYTSPNLFKPLHIGNLVGNIVGESVARLLEKSGAQVKRVNYPSDIGLTIAKGVWGLQQKSLNPDDIAELGRAYVAGNEAYDSGEAKEEIEAINRALYEDSNQEWSDLRRRGIATSLRHLHDLCARLGTKAFDREFFESESAPLGARIVGEHADTFEKSEGAVVYRGEQDGLHTRVFLSSQGLPTYEAKEVGLFTLKREAFPEFAESYTVTGSEQKDFFKVVFAALRRLYPAELEGKQLGHIPTGFLRLTTGKMSSRKGNVITGESLLQDITERARGREDVAVGAIKYAILRSGNGKDIVFDPEQSLSLEGDSGPYVQYALVRARALLRKAAEAKVADPAPAGPMPVERLIMYFPDVVERAARELEPHHVVTYLTELAAAFNAWYASERMIVDGTVTTRTLAVVKAVENTLAKGLEALGIPAPEEM
jgi:arginyl-tRNA synthetase